jgi:hypothetical protein
LIGETEIIFCLWEGRKEALWAVEQKSLENSRKIQRLQMWREAEE